MCCGSKACTSSAKPHCLSTWTTTSGGSWFCLCFNCHCFARWKVCQEMCVCYLYGIDNKCVTWWPRWWDWGGCVQGDQDVYGHMREGWETLHSSIKTFSAYSMPKNSKLACVWTSPHLSICVQLSHRHCKYKTQTCDQQFYFKWRWRWRPQIGQR